MATKTIHIMKKPLAEMKSAIDAMGLTEGTFDLDWVVQRNIIIGILSFMNDAPVIVDVNGGTYQYEAGTELPDFSTSDYLTYTDADNTLTTLTINTSELDMNMVGTYDVVWTVTDGSGGTATLTKVITIVDTTPPVITAEDETVTLALTPVWEPTYSVSDNTDEVLDGDVVITYFESDGTTPIVDLDAFRLYLGLANPGVVKFNVADSSGNNATEVSITINGA